MGATEYVSLALGVGILLGLFYSRRTGWGCGGLVTPGLLALKATDPLPLIGVLFLGSALGLLMRPISERFTLYGRERVGVLLLCALALRLLWRNDFFPIDSLWIGWVAPGLIAADVQRQGVLPTLSGAVSCGIGTAMIMGVLVSLYGVFA